MGLIAEIFSFDAELPAITAIARETEARFGRALVVEGTLVLSESDKAWFASHNSDQGHLATAVDARASIRVFAPSWFDRKRWVDLVAATGGTQIFLQSNHPALFRATCDALASLGGAVETPAQTSR